MLSVLGAMDRPAGHARPYDGRRTAVHGRPAESPDNAFVLLAHSLSRTASDIYADGGRDITLPSVDS